MSDIADAITALGVGQTAAEAALAKVAFDNATANPAISADIELAQDALASLVTLEDNLFALLTNETDDDDCCDTRFFLKPVSGGCCF